MAMLPGIYLRKRREAADLSIDDVVAMLPTDPHVDALARAEWLRQIEDHGAPIGADVLMALRYAFAFDATVLRRLDDLRRGAELPEPRLCRRCACSEFDPCDAGCWWVGEDLCSSCPPDGEPGTEAQPAIDDETAAPCPDNDGEPIDLAPGQQVRAFSKRWTPSGWEPVEEIATVIDPCVRNDPDYAGDVELKIEGILNRVFVPRASVEPIVSSGGGLAA